MSPHQIAKTKRLISQYEASAEMWMFEAQNYFGRAAENALNYARHLQTLAECLKLDLLEDQLMFQRKILP